jgi:deoxyribonuclease V
MKLKELHPWNVPPQEARSIQTQLAQQVERENHVPVGARLIAGVDISGVNRQGLATGAVVVLDVPTFTIREVRTVEAVPPMKYVPGLLSFREVPVLVKALETLDTIPDLIMVDGQGVAHPRRFGIASHLGLIMDLPSIGCGKSILIGKHDALDEHRGAQVPLMDRQDHLGTVLRTRTNISPVYVSVGHKIDLDNAVRWVLSCCRGYRLPEPTRLAHQAAAGRLRFPSPNGTSA